MSSSPASPISAAEAVNRSLNLVVTTLLGITALTFGSEIFVEVDSIDKVDNTLLVVIGVIAVAWYFMGHNWARRTTMPVVLAAAAVGAQIVGFGIEIGDTVALGDDIPGMIVFVSLLIISAVVYSVNGRYLAALSSATKA